jgi:hypothetical protein
MDEKFLFPNLTKNAPIPYTVSPKALFILHKPMPPGKGILQPFNLMHIPDNLFADMRIHLLERFEGRF